MLSYNSLTYVQDMKIGHYSMFPLNHNAEKHLTIAIEPEERRPCDFTLSRPSPLPEI